MKIQLALLALVPLCAAPTAAALGPSAVGFSRPHARFHAAIDALAEKASTGVPTPADHRSAADEIASASVAYGVPSKDVFLTGRLLACIAELEVMAQSAMYDLLELDVLHDQAIDAALEHALARIRAELASGRQPTPGDFAEVVASLTARADAARAWNPEIDAIVGRLRAEIDALLARARRGSISAKDLDPALDLATESRVCVVLTRLEERLLGGRAIEADFTDVGDAAKRVRVPDPDRTDLVERVEARLEELRALVEAGRATREEFAKLRDLLRIRARAASAAR